MKKFLSVMLSAVLVSFMGCTKDNLADGTQGAEDASTDHFYLDVAMSRPTATRSATDENDGKTNSDAIPDYEYGYDYENAVSEVLLVFADTDNKFIFAATASNILESPAEKPTTEFQFTAKASVKKSTITDEYAAGGMLADNKTVLIYAFCNPTTDLTEVKFKTEAQAALKGTTDWLDYAGTLEETVANGVTSSNIWSEGHFLMSNAKIKKADFPTTVEGWDPFSNPDNPFHLSEANDGSIDNSQSSAKLEYGPIYVERTACRFDFRDASQDLDDAHEDPFTYKLYGTGSVFNEGSEPTDKPNLLNVKLTKMSLVNMSKGYYYLRRVADNYNSSLTNVYVGGTELTNNYVVDTDWEKKNTHYSLSSYSDYSTAFNFPLFVENGDYNMSGWYGDALEDVVKGPNDTWTNATNGGKYHIWRYATENTIADADNQVHIQSVGLVFKGKIELGDDQDAVSNVVTEVPAEGGEGPQEPTIKNEAGYPYISEAVKVALESTTSTSPILYSFGGLLYAGFDGIAYTAVKNGYGTIAESLLSKWYLVAESEIPTSGTFTYYENAPSVSGNQYLFQLTPAIYELIKHKPESYTVPEGGIDWTTDFTISIADDLESQAWFKKALTDKGVTIYEPTQDGETWGYYCYYFYWNYHNNNGKPSEMGPMEFATVRNNVYKLAVTKLGRLGHPGEPKNDPDPIDPDDPDESDDLYFDVEIQVLPWVVRVNDIQF